MNLQQSQLLIKKAISSNQKLKETNKDEDRELVVTAAKLYFQLSPKSVESSQDKYLTAKSELDNATDFDEIIAAMQKMHNCIFQK